MEDLRVVIGIAIAFVVVAGAVSILLRSIRKKTYQPGGSGGGRDGDASDARRDREN